MEPRATAASAVVDIWPIDPTETITKEYSRMPVLLNGEMAGHRQNRYYPKTEREYLARIWDSSQNIQVIARFSSALLSCCSSEGWSGGLVKSGVVSEGVMSRQLRLEGCTDEPKPSCWCKPTIGWAQLWILLPTPGSLMSASPTDPVFESSWGLFCTGSVAEGRDDGLREWVWVDDMKVHEGNNKPGHLIYTFTRFLYQRFKEIQKWNIVHATTYGMNQCRKYKIILIFFSHLAVGTTKGWKKWHQLG